VKADKHRLWTLYANYKWNLLSSHCLAAEADKHRVWACLQDSKTVILSTVRTCVYALSTYRMYVDILYKIAKITVLLSCWRSKSLIMNRPAQDSNKTGYSASVSKSLILKELSLSCELSR
jgi:hypothetical protein